MAVTIVNISNDKFSINGVEYLKHFLSIVETDNVKIISVYDSNLILVDFINYADYTVDGVAFTSAILLQSALTNILFNRFVDEEDLTLVSNVIKLKDRDSGLNNKLGYKIIRSDFDFTSIPTGYSDSIWELRYDHDLLGTTVNLPPNVTLKFNGGFIHDGTLNFNNSKISTLTINDILFENMVFTGNLNQEEVSVNWFGVKSGVNKITVSTLASSTTITSSDYSFTPEDIGKKIQIYKSGHIDASFQSEIHSITNATTAVLKSSVITSKTDTIALLGYDAGVLIENVLNLCQSAKKIIFSGNYLIAKSDGSIYTQQRLDLKNSDTEYDFSGSKIYGMPILVDVEGQPQINNTIIRNAEVYCLGDDKDASAGNTNWNALAIIEGNNNTFENITIKMNGGVRALSVQTSGLNGGIKNCRVSGITMIGEIDGEFSDGIDISTGTGLIENVLCNDIYGYNLSSILIARNINNANKIKNIHCSNIKGHLINKVGVRFSRVTGGSINNISIEKTGANTESPFKIQDCDFIYSSNISIINTSPSSSYMTSLIDNISSNITDISLINKGAKNPNGIYIGSDELVIKGLYIENTNTGIYKLGRSCLIDGYTHKNITNPLRDNKKDIKMLLKNVVKLNGTNTPTEDDLSMFPARAYVAFDGSGAIGTIVPTRSKNIHSITKTATGLYTITLSHPLDTLPIVCGQGRKFGGGGKLIALESIPSKSTISIRSEKANGTTSDSDVINVIIF